MTNKVDHPFKKSNMPFAMKVFFGLTIFVFKVLGVVSPKAAGHLALRLFMKPPNSPAPRREKDIRDRATLSYRHINGKKIAVRVWEKKADAEPKSVSESVSESKSEPENSQTSKVDTLPTVLLSHGWAGRTSQFLEIIDALVNAGYRVVGADLPAHGDSSGTQTNMLDASQTLSAIAEEFSPLEAIVGHSFGTGITLLSLDKFDINARKIALIGAYSRVSFIIDLFSDTFELNQASREAMQQAGTDKFSNAYDIAWDWENIAPINTIKGYSGNVLFVHDEDDYEVPMDEVTELHQSRPDATLIITKGLGHRRILRDKSVAASVLDFIQE